MKINVEQRFLSFALALLMILSVMTIEVSAADISLCDNVIKVKNVTDNGNGSYSASASSYYECPGYKAGTAEVEIENTTSEDKIVSFSYTVSGTGTVKISDTTLTGTSTWNGTIAGGSSVKINLTSGSSRNNTITVSLSNFSASNPGAQITVDFMSVENGSYTVDGTVVPEGGLSKTAETGTSYSLVAIPETGYQFFGWKNSKEKVFSYDSSLTYTLVENDAITPIFISKDAALFGVGAEKFNNLTEACNYASTASTKTVVLLNNGTVSGSHTIPAGVTLLVPFDSANTLYTTKPGCTSSLGNNAAWVKPTAYRTLTLAADANITVNGSISVSGKHAASNGGKAYCGAPTGPVGFIKMVSGSQITLNSGANLYAWGYITGGGEITAKSGSTVYENFQFTDFRGGTNTSGLISDGLVFPINQYYVQNIEVKVTFEAGSTEKLYSSVYSSKIVSGGELTFMGQGGMFVPSTGSKITKDYIESEDRLYITVAGDSVLNSMSVDLAFSIDSSVYVLPMTNNMSIDVLSGNVELNQSISLLPGTRFSVAEGATVTLNNNETGINDYNTDGYDIIVYDYDEWTYGYSDYTASNPQTRVDGKFAFGSKTRIRPLGYVPGRTFDRTDANFLKDAKVDINGTVICNGYIYTTAGGANIISSEGTGKIVMTNGAGKDKWDFQSNNEVPLGIPIVPAQLKNGDGTYTDTSTAVAGDSFRYCAECDKWYKVTEGITVKYSVDVAATGSTADSFSEFSCHIIASENGFVRTGYVFDGWKYGDKIYSAGDRIPIEDSVLSEVTLLAQWKECLEHSDAVGDGDHNCDLCGEETGTPCAGGQREGVHYCDDCGEIIGECKDTDKKDHYCDYGCEKYFGEHEDTDYDHVCNYCEEPDPVKWPHVDENEKDHVCDTYGVLCALEDNFGEHEDKDCDHICDYGCSEPIGAHADGDKDHECDFYGKDCTAGGFGKHEDNLGNDHLCDVYGEECSLGRVSSCEGGTAYCDKSAVCTVCGKEYGSKDESKHDPANLVYTNDSSSSHSADCNGCGGTDVIVGGHEYDETTNYSCVCGDVKKFKIIYYVDGRVYGEEDIPYKTSITPPTAPTKTGHTFSGWDVNGDGKFDGNDVFPGEMPAEDLTLTAIWKVDQYTIVFNTDGGTDVAPITQDYGTAITKPGAPTKTGYSFLGWDVDGDGDVDVDDNFPAAMPAKDMTITATWKINQYTITFNTDGGTAIDSITQDYGTDVTEPANPTKEGYAFDGWDTEIPSIMPAENITVTANWKANEYTVTFDGNTNDGGSTENLTVKYDQIGVTVPECGFTKTGYSFTGWNTQPDGQGTGYVAGGVLPTIKGDVNLYAQWKINQYTITFDTDGGTDIAAFKQDYNTAVTAPADPIKEGCRFLGWDIDADGKYDAEKDIFPTTMPAHDIVAVAVWEVKTYTVTFDGNGGTTENGEGLVTETYNHGDTITTVSRHFVREGYDFIGWFDEYDMPADLDEISITSNRRFTAKWKINQYTITFYTDGGTVIDPITQDYGTSITKPGDPTKTGHTFIGWDVDADGKYDEEKDIFPTTMSAGDKTVIALWSVNYYKIIYNIEGNFYAEQTYKYGDTIKPHATYPEKIGYTFSGWSTDHTTMPDRDLILNAGYTINKYTITIKFDNGDEDKVITQDYGTAITKPGDPTKTGYEFLGWDVDGDGIVDDNSKFPTIMPATDMTITAKWQINQYTITIKFGNGIEDKVIAGDYGSAIDNNIADPTMVGYTFTGWSEPIPATMPAGDMTITAKWKINQYTITFDTDGGTAIDSITRDFGTEVTEPTAPTKTGYTFDGWDTEIPATMPADNLTITAQWKINQYTVTIVYDNGTENKVITQNYATAIGAIENPTKIGYTFAGWDAEIPATMPAGDMTIKAKWTINQYTITFDTDGGTAIDSITQDFGTEVTEPTAPTKTGYTFNGWDAEIPATMPAGDMTIKAKWTINQYTITFNTDGGTAIDSITQDFGTEVTEPADPTKTGYTFAGWDTEIPANMPAGDMTITAQWTINQYTITFNTDGGSEIAAITQNFGTGVIKPADPTKLGYTFAGWDAEIPATMPAGGLTIKAQWTINQYTITFDTDGGTAIEPITQDYNTAVTVPEEPTKIGYTFAGWTPVVPSTMPANDVTIKAKWTINQYTITFNTDGGSEIAAITQDYGTAVTKPVAPTKIGYTFAGWDAEIPANMPAGDMTITANWTINQYTITFNTDGGSDIAAITQNFGTEVTVPTAPTKIGYTFDGWDVSVPSTMPAKNVTITAKWKINQYTITFNTDGGSEIKAISQDYGTGIIVPANPTKTGYTFDCWDTEIPATMPAENLTVTAIWTIKQYTVTFKNGYDGTVIKTDKLNYNSLITYPENPERVGYSFIGWDNVITNVPANDVTINAAWNINQYTVTIIYGNGTDNKVITQDYGTAIDAIENPTMTGYIFDGWDVEIPATMPAENLTITAQWKINQYTITFDTKGGTVIAPIKQDFGSAVTAPNDPEKEGYTFKGWDENGDGTADVLPEVMPLGGKSYTAIWEVNSYTVTFTVNGEFVESFTVKYGDPIPVPDYTVDDNQNFYGWVVPDTMPAGDQTYDAKRTNDYFVTWWIHGEDGIVVPVIVTYEQDADLSNVPTGSVFCENYSIVGWAASQGGEIVTLPEKVTGNVQYYAVYEHKTDDVVYKYKDVGNKTHTKYFDCCGTVIDENADHVYDNVAHKCECGDIENFTITYYVDGELYAVKTYDYGAAVTALTYTKVGHTFSGWDKVLPATMPAENIDLNGTTTVDQYTITFDTDGGSDVSPITQNYGTSITKPTDPEREGYTFDGWDVEIPDTMPAENMTVKAKWKINQYTVTIVYNNGNADKVITKNFGETIEAVDDPVKTGYTFIDWDKTIPATMPAEDMIITAQWEAIQYTISFNTVGGSTVDSITGIYESTVTGPADPVKEGYTFVGWTPNVPATMPAQNVTLTANWTINQYTVTFDVDGDKTLITPITGDYNTVINAPAAPTKEGYTFAGWSPVLPETIPAENMTVAATWTINQYTITFDTDGGTAIDSITQNFGTEVTEPTAPTKIGYAFGGWDVPVPSTMPAENVTIKAKWTINEYTITFDTVGGTAIDSITQDFGTEVTEPTAPTKTGYAFDGWDVPVPSTMPAENVTITAKWKINQYTITFNTDGGTAIDSITQDYGTGIIVPANPTKTGYTFAGWDTNIPANMPAENMTIKAKWTINEYTITFDTVGGTAIDSITQNYGTGIIVPANPTKTGYAFDGWDVPVPSTMPAENVTITAKWKINQYTITFNTDGGTAIDSITQDYGTEITKLADPIKIGYTFAGWDAEIPANMPAGDMTITANWTINQYTITFNTDGGTAIDSITQDYGTGIIVPANPTKTGYTFAGWDTNIPANMPAENMTIKAKWTVNQYTITFNTDGGTAIDSITQDFGTEVTEPADPTKTGYTFAGWDTEIPANMPAGDMTITAQWKINQYTITFNTDGGSEIAAITQNFGTGVTKPADPTKLGYTFKGWDAEIPDTMPADNLTITAQWKINQYTITFDTDGGTAIEPITQDYNTAVTVPEEPTKIGYTFAGWTPVVPSTVPANDVTIKAKWTINQYTITFNTDGGSEIAAITQDYGTAVTKPVAPTKIGYIFAGWDAEIPANMPAGDMTITANWTINQYTITFNTDGGSDIAAITQDFGTEVTVPTAPTKIGYTFDGWDVSVPSTMPAKNVTITAKWKINQYTITFNTDGGSEIADIKQDYGTAVKVPAAPTKTGYTFAGWDKNIPGKMPAGDITITALWTINKYTVTFDTNGGSVIGNVYADYGTAIVPPADPTKTGYTFAGWDKEIPSTIPAENVTITAQWTINQYTITFDTDGGTAIESITQDYNTAVTAPADPTKTGYTFAGWTPAVPSAMPADDITVKAQWTINQYTITFDTDGGNAIAAIKQDYNTAVIAPADPTKTGYTFAGWDTNIPANMPAENMTIKAKWTVNQYTITFDTAGGSTVDVITQDYNTVVTVPADPTRTGYTFAGWDKTIPTNMPAGDLTITATWQINQYTVTFYNGSTVISRKTYNYGETIEYPTDPTKLGYTFAGWDCELETVPSHNLDISAEWTINQYAITFLDYDGNVIHTITDVYGAVVTEPMDPTREGYSFAGWDKTIPSSMPADNVTITATWKINRYTITYDTVGGSRVNSFTGDYGTAVTKPADPTKTGYTFDGWDVAVPDTVPAGNITITAKWKVNSYKVTFLNGYDAVISEIDCEFGSEIVYPQNPEREGYTFIGWDSNEINVPARDITITAKWSINKYTISFADTGDKNIQSITQDYGTAVIAPANPTKYGHTFAGWDTEMPATMPGEDITITALWTVNQYKIIFNTDGGSEIAPIVQDYGTDIIAPADPTRDGYTFIGWNKAIPSTMPAEEVVITARWQINQYTVTFDVNGGTLDEEQPSSVSGNYGTPVTRPTDPAKMGYTFIGWDVNDDGVISEDDVFPATIPGRDLTLKALWTINSYTVTFEDGYSDTPIKVDTAEYDSVIVYPAAPKRVGHTFAGWDSDISNVPSKNVTITALWKVNEYTVSYYDALSGEAVLVKTEKVPYGEAIPNFPYVHAGYTLLYWTLKDSTDPYLFPETMPAENIDLYAVLELNYYNVSFINLGEKLAEKDGFIYGDSVYEVMGEIGVESRTGYTFMGWFDEDGRKYTEGYTVPDNEVVFTAKWEANKHEVNIVFTKDNCEEYADIQLISYDTPILSKLPVLTGYTGIDGIYHEFIGWDYFDDHGGTEVPETMPDCNINIYAVYAITGWVSAEVNGVSGMQYIVRDEVQKTGWTEIDGNWYYLDPITGLREVGLTRVAYPDAPINGVTYAPDPDDLASAEKYGYTDAETARFIFDENGVFRGDINGLYGDNWAVNGHLPWHVGLVQIGEDYYYYFRGNTTAKSENVYVVRNTTKLDVTVGGVYTFDENGKLAKYDGITDIGNTRYYYEDYRLMLGKGLIKVEDDYYYVRSSGALVVSTTGYWVSKTNNFDVAAGYYDFDAEGKLISTVKEKQNGIYSEIDGIFYYEDGVRTAKGLIRVNGTNSSYDGKIIYVRANGQLVVGKYWVTNTGGLMERGFYYFDENGILVEEKNGIIDGYYYVDGKIAYGAGLILIDGDYYYVRSNGSVAVGDYWITNVNDTGVIVGKYNFADDGKMTTDPLFIAENATTGVYDGFYYENGKIAYAKGIVEYDGGYIYVRSSGRIATGKYWATNHNGLLPAGLYDFGEDGILSF